MISSFALHNPMGALTGGFPYWWTALIISLLLLVALIVACRSLRGIIGGTLGIISVYTPTCIALNEVHYFVKQAAETSRQSNLTPVMAEPMFDYLHYHFAQITYWWINLVVFALVVFAALVGIKLQTRKHVAQLCLSIAASLMLIIALLFPTFYLSNTSILAVWGIVMGATVIGLILQLVMKPKPQPETDDPAALQRDSDGL